MARAGGEGRKMSERLMSRTRQKVETELKPAVQMARSGLIPNGHLLADGMDLIVSHYEEIFRAMDERHKKLCWYEFCLTPELFFAMDIHPFLGELHPGILTLGTPDQCWDYIDAAEMAGAPPELCVLDKMMHGALLENEMPEADFVVTSSAPCDSSRIGYQMFERIVDRPFFRLDAPVEDTHEAHLYYASEIRKLIGFLEEQTGTRFDADRLREVCEESNRATEAFLELFELKRARPCPHPGEVMASGYTAMLACLGSPAFTRYAELLRDDAAEAVRQGRGAVADERHRVLWYYVPVTFDLEMYKWLEENFKAVVIMDLLFGFFRQDPIDTTSLDTMLLSLARRGLETTMSRLRVSGDRLTERFLRDYDDFGADCVVFPSPAGCKHVWGWLSLLRETCRERDIPICVFDLDWMDSRVRSVDSIRTTIEQFFTTVME
jgi:benzoyl-CoA reductase/2-hydroxyglutaryl-CoA dehydratase subunit BcrC/BadD/HgdB